MNNKQIIEKSAMVLSDLETGGLMNPQQYNTFMRMIRDQPTILKEARYVPMKHDSMKVEKIGFGQRILRAGEEATPLSREDRSKPQTGKVELNAQEVIAEVNLSYDTLENNIEEDKLLEDTIMELISERASLDIEEVLLNGDVDSEDDYLALFNGVLKQADQHIYDAKGESINREVLKNIMKQVPSKYQRNKRQWRHYVSHNVELDWRDHIADRQTNLGDSSVQGGDTLAFGAPVKGIAMLEPYNLGGGEDGGGGTLVSNSIYTHPQNILYGVSRNIRVEVDRDIRARTFIIVLTCKLDVKLEEKDAVGIVQGIKE